MAKRDPEGWPYRLGADPTGLSEELSSRRVRLASCSAWEPFVDLVEESSRVVIKAEIAGVTLEGLELVYIPERHSLVVRGSRLEDAESDQPRVGVFQLEILYGSFEREIALPDIELDTTAIKALYRNGLLLVLIPKQS